MNSAAVVTVLALVSSASLASAAVRTPSVFAEESPDAAMSDAKATARSASQAPHPAPAPESAPSEEVGELRRAWLQQHNVLSARVDELEARLYEIVGRLQVLTGCLILFLTGILVAMIEVWRRSARR